MLKIEYVVQRVHEVDFFCTVEVPCAIKTKAFHLNLQLLRFQARVYLTIASLPIILRSFEVWD